MNLMSEVKKRVQNAFDVAGFTNADILVKVSDRPDMSDYQSNGALPLAKKEKKNPREIASKIADELKKDSFFKTVSVDGPGFINMTIADEALAHLAYPILSTPKGGYERADKPKKVVLDYGGPNVGKALHIGHLRPANIGDSVRRIMAFAGDETIGDAHLGDWGRPMGLVITELKHTYPDMPYFKADYVSDEGYQIPFTIKDVAEAYPTASAKAKADETYMAEAKEATRLLQTGHKGYYDLWKRFVEITVADDKEIFDTLGIHFDLWWGESRENERGIQMVERMKEKGLAVLDDGAIVVPMEGDTPPAILVNSAGAMMYATTDLATIEERVEVFQPNEIIYFTDLRQGLHFSQVFAVAQKDGMAPNVHFEFQGFGTITGADNKPYKTRDGGVASLRSVIEMAEEAARKKMDAGEIGRDLTDDEKKEISKIVGISALKFIDLANDKIKNYIFDPDKMTSTEGKTGPYLLYAMVRMKSVLEKMNVSAELSAADKIVLTMPAERNLLLRLFALPEAVQTAYDNRAPHVIADYLYKLCQDFNLFYHDCPIKDAAPDVQKSRLALTKYTLHIGTMMADLLGLKVPDKM